MSFPRQPCVESLTPDLVSLFKLIPCGTGRIQEAFYDVTWHLALDLRAEWRAAARIRLAAGIQRDAFPRADDKATSISKIVLFSKCALKAVGPHTGRTWYSFSMGSLNSRVDRSFNKRRYLQSKPGGSSLFPTCYYRGGCSPSTDTYEHVCLNRSGHLYSQQLVPQAELSKQ